MIVSPSELGNYKIVDTELLIGHGTRLNRDDFLRHVPDVPGPADRTPMAAIDCPVAGQQAGPGVDASQVGVRHHARPWPVQS